jgi:hypothetical protein
MMEGAMVIVVRGRCFLRKGQVPQATYAVSPPASKFYKFSRHRGMAKKAEVQQRYANGSRDWI